MRPASGQSLIESALVIGILCLLLMGLLQLSQMYMAAEILDFAAGRGARAYTVGFNDFMVRKTVRVGTIASAGAILSPEIGAGPARPLTLNLGQFTLTLPLTTHDRPATQRAVERARIPLYLGAESPAELDPILNYSNWPAVSYESQAAPPLIHFQVLQDFPLSIPLHRTFYAADHVPLRGEAYLEDHAALYLERP